MDDTPDGVTPDGIGEAFGRLRRQSRILAAAPQSDVVDALGELAARWRDPGYPLRREAARWTDPFPFAMVRVSLNALLDSLRPEAVWRLIDAEDVRDVPGGGVAGHVIAANTPLLAWVGVLRALLVRRASLVKLPSGPAGRWGKMLGRALADVSPPLAGCVHLAQWPGGTRHLDAALCAGADLVVAHGGDAAISALRALCPRSTPFVGYGHRVSFGLVARGAETPEAAAGLARDVLLFDQGGCLSPQTVFVEGGWPDALAFAQCLADALADATPLLPLPARAARAPMAVREARALARMEGGCRLWEDAGLRWTVIARPAPPFAPSPTFGVVSVQPLASLSDLPAALSPVAHALQGCAVAGTPDDYLPHVPRLCAPGELQAPPLSWRQDGRDVLRSLAAV